MPQNAVNGRIKLAITEPLVASGWFRGVGVFAYVLNFIFTPLKPFFFTIRVAHLKHETGLTFCRYCAVLFTKARPAMTEAFAPCNCVLITVVSSNAANVLVV